MGCGWGVCWVGDIFVATLRGYQINMPGLEEGRGTRFPCHQASRGSDFRHRPPEPPLALQPTRQFLKGFSLSLQRSLYAVDIAMIRSHSRIFADWLQDPVRIRLQRRREADQASKGHSLGGTTNLCGVMRLRITLDKGFFQQVESSRKHFLTKKNAFLVSRLRLLWSTLDRVAFMIEMKNSLQPFPYPS